MSWNESELPTWNPKYREITRTIAYTVKVVTFKSGQEQRWKEGIAKWRFTLSFKNITHAQADEIYTFYVGRSGLLIPFKFYDKWDDDYKFCRFDTEAAFAMDNLRYARSSQIDIVEVHPSEIVIGA